MPVPVRWLMSARRPQLAQGVPGRLHVALTLLVAVIIPLASRLFGDGFFAWTMYSSASEYRIRIEVTDASGRRSVAPTGLCEGASASVAEILVGAESFRPGSSLAVLEAHADELARFVCEQRHADEVAITLEERPSEGGPERVRTTRATCSAR